MSVFSLVLAVALNLVPGQRSTTGIFMVGGGRLSRVESRAEVSWQENSLKVRVITELEKGHSLKVRGSSDRPEGIFSGDAIELFLCPHVDDAAIYYQFGVNPSNVVYCAKGRDQSWKPLAKIVTEPFFGEDHWGVVFDLPFAAFGVARPCIGERWRANFAVGDNNWAATSLYHDPATFGELVFEKTPADSAVIERVHLDDNGILHLGFAVGFGGEYPHKGVRDFDFVLTGDGRELAGLKGVMESADCRMLEPERFYYEAGHVFSEGRVRDAWGGVVEGPLSPGEYVYERQHDGEWMTCRITVRADQAQVRATRDSLGVEGSLFSGEFETGERIPYYPIMRSTGDASLTGRRRLLLSGTVVTNGFHHFVYSSRKPLYGALDVLAIPETAPFSLNRLAYESQLGVLVEGASGIRTEVDPLAFYPQLYRQLKERFPERLFSIHVDAPGKVASEIVCAADVLEMSYPYCVFSRNPLVDLAGAVDYGLRAAQGKPLVFWLGASLPDNGRCRTADELSTAVRFSILRGAAGNTFHVGHGGIPKTRTRLWDLIDGIEAEVCSWYPEWVRGCKSKALKLVPDGRVYAEARQLRDGSFMLLAVNLSPRTKTLAYVEPTTGHRRLMRLSGYGNFRLIIK